MTVNQHVFGRMYWGNKVKLVKNVKAKKRRMVENRREGDMKLFMKDAIIRTWGIIWCLSHDLVSQGQISASPAVQPNQILLHLLATEILTQLDPRHIRDVRCVSMDTRLELLVVFEIKCKRIEISALETARKMLSPFVALAGMTEDD
jgi:hypothetical protein